MSSAAEPVPAGRACSLKVLHMLSHFVSRGSTSNILSLETVPSSYHNQSQIPTPFQLRRQWNLQQHLRSHHHMKALRSSTAPLHDSSERFLPAVPSPLPKLAPLRRPMRRAAKSRSTSLYLKISVLLPDSTWLTTTSQPWGDGTTPFSTRRQSRLLPAAFSAHSRPGRRGRISEPL